MADNSPSVPRLPLLATPENRDASTLRDAKLINGFAEKSLEGDWYVYKRPGVKWQVQLAANAVGQGIYNWNETIYCIAGGNFYSLAAPFTTPTLIGAVDGTNGVYTFSSCLGATPKLFFHNGVKGYTYDPAGGLHQVTDANFVSLALVKGCAYLDQTMYVMDNTATIWASNLNDPTTWPASFNVQAQIDPETGIFLGKQLVYVIALKQHSTEVFYDAANATGSPLGRVPGSKANVGCRSANSVQWLEGALFWLSQSMGGSIGACIMDNVKVQQIETPAITRLLENADFTTVFSWSFKLSGHKFYGVTVKNANLTLVYDVTSQLWYQWADDDGDYFPYVSSTDFNGQHALLQHETNGSLYTIDMANTADVLTAGGQKWGIRVDLYTPNFDGGYRRRRKYLPRLQVIADQTPGSVLQIRHNDEDYSPGAWSPFRTLDLSQRQPFLLNCGSFYRRAWHFRHFCDAPLRMQYVEVPVVMGTN